MSPVGTIFVPFPPEKGTNMLHAPPIVELVFNRYSLTRVYFAFYQHAHFTSIVGVGNERGILIGPW